MTMLIIVMLWFVIKSNHEVKGIPRRVICDRAFLISIYTFYHKFAPIPFMFQVILFNFWMKVFSLKFSFALFMVAMVAGQGEWTSSQQIIEFMVITFIYCKSLLNLKCGFYLAHQLFDEISDEVFDFRLYVFVLWNTMFDYGYLLMQWQWSFANNSNAKAL